MLQKNIIITGTSRGIGYELVKQCQAKGHRVLALSRNTSPIDHLHLSNTQSLEFDITQGKDLQKAVNYIQQHWSQVDVVIHNAGQIIHKDFTTIHVSELNKVYATNVFGVFTFTQALLPFFHADSHIISISSMGGIQGSVKFPGLTAYSSSKAAVINLMEVLAEEYKETGPIFNALALGAVQTEMFEEAFPGAKAGVSPREMAAYIIQFALTGNRVYNGKVLQVSNSTP